MAGDALRLDDPRADTLTAYLRVLRDTKPRAFLLENVYGLVYKGKDEGLRYLLDGVARINREAGTNYQVSWKLLNAARYGVPQIRERVFLIGSRDGGSFEFPLPTHDPPGDLEFFDLHEPYRTAWDAIGDLPEDPSDPSLEVGGKWGALLPSIPEGQNYLWHTNRGGGLRLFGWRTRYWSFLLKLAKSQPSWTIQAQPGSAIGPFHWRSRKLTTREMCRLQTFPDDVGFDCGRRHDCGRSDPRRRWRYLTRHRGCRLRHDRGLRGGGRAWCAGRRSPEEDRRRVSPTAAIPRSRSYRQAGAGDRAAAMEEGDGLPSAGARGERLLPVQVHHR